MSQDLDGGDDLNAEHSGISVHLTQLLLCVSAAHITEIRKLRNLVDVLHIGHEGIQTHKRHFAKCVLDCLHIKHVVA